MRIYFKDVVSLADFAERPQNTVAAVGSSVIFNCSVSVSSGVNCRWKHNNTMINSAGNDLSLKLPNVGIDDEGLYTCEIKGNTGKSLRRTSRLTVLCKLNYVTYSQLWYCLIHSDIQSHPVDISVATGSSANFTCEASLPDSVTYQWKHNSMILDNETSTVLSINDVQMSNIGEYYCIVTSTDNNATVISDVARLSVHGMTLILYFEMQKAGFSAFHCLFLCAK